MDIVPIQASSVPCERAFSSGKETMAPQRNRISPQLMEALQMLKYSIKKGRPLNFTQGMSWTEELREFEFAAQVEPVGDAEAYGRSLEQPEENLSEIEELLDDIMKDLEGLETEDELASTEQLDDENSSN
jgi:hAT family C-terminal dimerisation region